ncbi:MAG: hypothetical protein RL150_163 [Candidatus Parcubacteria bacterium]|jgi:5-(carboxyamino)imidazole ribonucleotide synthase
MKSSTLPIIPGATIGILGGGQLGKMSLMAAHQLGYHTVVWAAPGDNPAMEMATHRIEAPYTDRSAFEQFLELADVTTTEWENIPLWLMKELQNRGVIVRPGARVLEVAQSRLEEKRVAMALSIPTTEFLSIPFESTFTEEEIAPFLPGILKTNRLGYDGKGQFPVSTFEEFCEACAKADAPCVLEKCATLKTEISVLVARTADGLMSVSDVVENLHKNGILDVTMWPPEMDVLSDRSDAVDNLSFEEEAQRYALNIANHLGLEGILCLEFFVTEDGRLLFNEMAPRPHNSFHGSIEAASTSQFEQHVRAICGLPLGEVTFHTAFTMQNLIGGSWDDWSEYLNIPNTRLHLYGKQESREGRKMGHVTMLRDADDTFD